MVMEKILIVNPGDDFQNENSLEFVHKRVFYFVRMLFVGHTRQLK